MKTVCVKERLKKTCWPCQAPTGQGLLVNYDYCLKSEASEQPVDYYLCDLVSVAQSVSAFGCYLNMGNRKVGGSNPPGDDTFFPFLKSSCIVDFVNVNVNGIKGEQGRRKLTIDSLCKRKTKKDLLALPSPDWTGTSRKLQLLP